MYNNYMPNNFGMNNNPNHMNMMNMGQLSTYQQPQQQQVQPQQNKVVKIIDEYRKENGEPPATMSALWDFSHKIIMEEADDVKILQEHYKKL